MDRAVIVRGKGIGMELSHKVVMRLLMSAFYFIAGYLHFTAPAGFVSIVPKFIPWPDTIVWVTGILELAGAAGLLLPRLRFAAGIGLATYAVCVFPANIYHAMAGVDVEGLPSSWWYHVPRFLLQPVLVWWALYCSGVVTWPRHRN